MYIRVKRSKTTYFIQCDPTETTLDIKQKLHTLIDQPVNDQRLILLNTGEILEDSKTLADQKVQVIFSLSSSPYAGKSFWQQFDILPLIYLYESFEFFDI